MIQIPNTIFNVVEGENDKVYFDLGGATSVTLTPGIYSTATLTSHLQTVLQASQASFTATFSSVTKRITIANDSAFSLDFGTNTTASAARLLGFTTADTASATSHTAPNMPQLNISTSLICDVKESDERLTTSSLSGLNFGSFWIVLTADYGTFTSQSFQDLPQYLRFSASTRTLSIKLYNVAGDLVSLNNSDWTLLLQRVE